MANAMPDFDLEAELKKEREAQAMKDKLKAQQQALFDLSSNQAQTKEVSSKGKDQAQTKEAPNSSTSAAISSTKPAPSENDVFKKTGVYIPPTWNTAGQEPPGAIQRPQENADALVDTEAITMPMCGCGGTGPGVGTELFASFGLNPPTEESFEIFFRGWFEVEHFPQMSEDVKKELVHRAKSKSFFSGLSSQVKKWAMANTDVRLQSEAWCNYFLQNAPPHYRIIGCVRKASVNLGSQVTPCWLTFFGIPAEDGGAKWILPPFCHGTADIPSVLDELDGRGGMTALVQSAVS